MKVSHFTCEVIYKNYYGSLGFPPSCLTFSVRLHSIQHWSHLTVRKFIYKAIHYFKTQKLTQERRKVNCIGLYNVQRHLYNVLLLCRSKAFTFTDKIIFPSAATMMSYKMSLHAEQPIYTTVTGQGHESQSGAFSQFVLTDVSSDSPLLRLYYHAFMQNPCLQYGTLDSTCSVCKIQNNLIQKIQDSQSLCI